MKYMLLLIPFLLTGCIYNPTRECTDTCTVKVPIYVKPQFNTPERPVLRDTIDSTTDGELVRVVELNLFDLINYTLKLESILEEIKK